MAKKTVAGAATSGPAQVPPDNGGRLHAAAAPDLAGSERERRHAATEAAYEIESIVRLLQRLDGCDDKAYLQRGAFLRIEALTGVIMSVTSYSEPDREIAEMRKIVFGPLAASQFQAKAGNDRR